MQTYTLTPGTPYTLHRTEIATPEPQAHEVLIRLHAASLNYLDLMVAWGRFGTAADTAPRDFIPGTDGAGEIAALGEGVQGWAVGERVVPGNIVDWRAGALDSENIRRLRGVTLPGSLAQYASVPAGSLVRIPGNLSYAQAATLPIAATTAWNALSAARVRPGATVLLLGTGGVSLFALQLAKAAGARVIILSSSDAKLERARAMGADVLVNYRSTPAWDDAVLAATGGKGADLVVETVGPDTFTRSMNAAAMGGTIFVVGFISGMEITIPILPINLKRLRIIGSHTGSTADLAEAARAIELNRIAPVIDQVFGFAEAAAAYRHLEQAGHFGKVVIDLDG